MWLVEGPSLRPMVVVAACSSGDDGDRNGGRGRRDGGRGGMFRINDNSKND